MFHPRPRPFLILSVLPLTSVQGQDSLRASLRAGDIAEVHFTEVKGPEVDVLEAVALPGLGPWGEEQGFGERNRPAMSLCQALGAPP